MAVTTLNQIVQNLNEIANKHQQLHGFKFGDPWEFYTSGVCDCAELWLQPQPAVATVTTIDHTFTAWLLDGVRRGEINELEVQSDMISVAQDIIAQLHHPDYGWAFERSQKVTINPVTEKTPYKLSGVWFQFTLKLMYPADTCKIPLSDSVIIYPLLSSTPSTTQSYITGNLTIGELVFADSTSSIASLSVLTYPSLTELARVKGLTSDLQTQLNGKQASLGFTPENSANKVTSISGASTDVQYGSAKLLYDQLALKHSITIAPLEITNAMLAGSIDLTTKVTGVLPTANGGMDTSSYIPIRFYNGIRTAGNVAGTYWMGFATAGTVSGTAIGTPPLLIYIAAADYPTVNGLATKLRIRGSISPNNTAPTGDFYFALFPMTCPASSGGASVHSWTIGTEVAGSATNTVVAPSANTIYSMVGSDFALPADGFYCICIVTTATVAANSLVITNAELQKRNA